MLVIIFCVAIVGLPVLGPIALAILALLFGGSASIGYSASRGARLNVSKSIGGGLRYQRSFSTRKHRKR